MKSKPLFIVLAGGEGSGKGTQIKMLKEKYPDAVFTREPGGSEYAEKLIRPAVVDALAKGADPYSHMGVALAGCYDSLKNIVAPALASSKNVFSDRSALICTYAYEVAGLNGKHLEKFFIESRKFPLEVATPDLYIVLDVDVKEGMKRANARKMANGESNHFDERKADFHQKVKQGYLDFAKMFSNNTVVIDANPAPDIVFKSIISAIEKVAK